MYFRPYWIQPCISNSGIQKELHSSDCWYLGGRESGSDRSAEVMWSLIALALSLVKASWQTTD